MVLLKNNTIMKKNLVKHLKGQRKSHKGRICRERSNNAKLKRTEKRIIKQ